MARHEAERTGGDDDRPSFAAQDGDSEVTGEGDYSTPQKRKRPRRSGPEDDVDLNATMPMSVVCNRNINRNSEDDLMDSGPSTASSTPTGTSPDASSFVGSSEDDDDSSPSSEGFLRAILKKVAPSEAMSRLAQQVSFHLNDDDSAREQLAIQLVERAQTEPLFAPTYAQLSAIIVRSRGGFVFYKHLLDQLRGAFKTGIDNLIIKASTSEAADDTNISRNRLVRRIHSLTGGGRTNRNPLWSEAAQRRHRLGALCVFLSQLYLEDLLSRDQLLTDFLQTLEGHLPHPVAVECLCKTFSRAGRRLEGDLGAWLDRLLRYLEAIYSAPQSTQTNNNHAQIGGGVQASAISTAADIPTDRKPEVERSLRMVFMVKDVIELRARNWQPRDAMARVRSLSEESEP